MSRPNTLGSGQVSSDLSKPIVHFGSSNVCSNGPTRTSEAVDKPVVDAATEAVDHPSHYGGADNPYEAIKVIRAWGASFAVGNALKYLARAGKKDPTKVVEDLRKAVFYLEDEIAHIAQAS